MFNYESRRFESHFNAHVPELQQNAAKVAMELRRGRAPQIMAPKLCRARDSA
jgi:hypothetical protein